MVFAITCITFACLRLSAYKGGKRILNGGDGSARAPIHSFTYDRGEYIRIGVCVYSADNGAVDQKFIFIEHMCVSSNLTQRNHCHSWRW